jgi:hypothetical protein
VTGRRSIGPGFTEAVDTAAEPFRPAMVAMPDAAGMAIELNQLALQRALEWTEQPERKWKFETACAIGALRTGVENGAVKDAHEYRQQAYRGTPLGLRPGSLAWGATAEYPQPLDTLRAQALETATPARAGQINAYYGDLQWMAHHRVAGDFQRRLLLGAEYTTAVDAYSSASYTDSPIRNEVMQQARAWLAKRPQQRKSSDEAVADDAWAKYRDMLKGGDQKTADWESYLKTTYKEQFNTFEHSVIKPLDVAYLAWLKSDAFKTHFTHNFDPQDFRSGQAYQVLAYSCIQDATGRQAVVDHLMQCLADDPTEPGSVFLRALVFNQQALATRWSEAALEKGGTPQTPWLPMGAQLYDGLKDILAKEHIRDLNGTFAGLSKSIYQLSAPILNRLNGAVAGAIEVAARLGNLPIAERRLLGLMQALALSNDPNARLVVASGTLSRGKLAKAIASQLGDLTGQGKGVWRSAARETAKQIKAKEITYHGIFQLSQDEVDELIRTEASARQATLSASLREAQEEARFSRLLSGNVRRLLGHEVAAGGLGLILSGFVMGNIMSQLGKAEGAKYWTTVGSLVAGASTFLGEVGKMSGAILEKTTWGTQESARIMEMSGESLRNVSELLSGAGRLLGVVGGVLAGAIGIVEGGMAFADGDVVFGIGSVLLGAAWIVTALITMSAGVTLIVFLLLIAIGYVLSLFRHDKLQHWLDSCYFGKHELGDEKFNNLYTQTTAYEALFKEG